MVAVQFAPDGSFTNVVTKEFPDQQIGPLAPQSRRELRRWERELKAHDATISIKRFFIPERQIGIQDLPEHYLEFLANRDTYDEERRRELQSDVDNWLRDGDFVLYWTEDYYLDRTGEVVSS